MEVEDADRLALVLVGGREEQPEQDQPGDAHERHDAEHLELGGPGVEAGGHVADHLLVLDQQPVQRHRQRPRTRHGDRHPVALQRSDNAKLVLWIDPRVDRDLPSSVPQPIIVECLDVGAGQCAGELERDLPFGVALQLFEKPVSRFDDAERERFFSGSGGWLVCELFRAKSLVNAAR